VETTMKFKFPAKAGIHCSNTKLETKTEFENAGIVQTDTMDPRLRGGYMKTKNPNIFQYAWAAVRFTAFGLFTIPFLISGLFFPKHSGFGPKALRFFMAGLGFFGGMKVKVHGKISDARPMMIISNHISVFELAALPIAFGNSFFAKKEMEKWPFIGWMSKKFGVIYVDRNPMTAHKTLAALNREMARASWPMAIYPEGTTTNGAYVKPFKSAMFNFMEQPDGTVGGITVQPVILTFRHKDGTKMTDCEIAEHYAYFTNAKQDCGPCCTRERGLIEQVFHVFAMGGFLVELYVLPPPSLDGISGRKELADYLQKIVSEKYLELK
jgi:1-acyl-sn-glycerol-3-phosphate acyltransferase